jgi:serine/threonine-protein kinase
LKPGNVLFAEDGSAKITDFGLAKILDGDDSATVSEAILGTPVYMAPEQARGEGRQIGPWTDVYALGAILYEMLAGRTPFRGGSRSQTLELVREGEVEPPSRRCWGLPRDLEAICLKCLEKEPDRRYPSASALAEDLQCWLRGEPTTARPASWSMRLWRRLRRHPRWASAAALLLFAAAAVPVAVWIRDPDRPLRAIEAELARGRAQLLIGETGPPAWFDWCLGKETSTASTSENEPFSIHTSNLALLELVRDPQRDRFKLVAQLQHERNMDAAGAIGIFVAHQRYASQQGPAHYFLPLTFNDLHDESQRPVNFPANELWQKANRALLTPRLFWEETRWSEYEYCLSGPGPELFQPAGALGQKPSWRPLTLLVSPDGVRGFWGWDETPVGRLSAIELGPEVTKSLEERRQEHPEEPRFQGFEPAFFPRGSLGLYVSRGSASFRWVAIEPLNTSD